MRIAELYIEMYERNYIHLKDVEMIQLWLTELRGMGYEFPAVGCVSSKWKVC